MSDIGQDELKPKLEAYHFQRRMLLGCTALIGLGTLIWIVAISTDHWFMVSGGKGIFIHETRRFFLSSHSGIWTVCRYALTPMLLPNLTIARNFSLISHNNPIRIQNLRNELVKQPYVTEFLQDKTDSIDAITEIDNTFKKVMFATWLTLDTTFAQYRDKFQSLKRVEEYRPKDVQVINPTHMEEIKNLKGGKMATIVINGTTIHLLLPEAVDEALFDDWEDKSSIVYLLGAYVKDLGLSSNVVNSDGVRYIFEPPVPPKKGKSSGNGYEYRPFKSCRNHKMFPTDQEISDNPAIDDEIIDYNRAEATFAIITVMVMLMGFIFSIYTFLNPRYMFKRLAGGIHFISASTSFVVLQVLAGEVEYQKEYMSYNFPKGASFSFGYGYWLAWFVFALNLCSCLSFLWFSKKKKGEKAATEELGMADEPINIGR